MGCSREVIAALQWPSVATWKALVVRFGYTLPGTLHAIVKERGYSLCTDCAQMIVQGACAANDVQVIGLLIGVFVRMCGSGVLQVQLLVSACESLMLPDIISLLKLLAKEFSAGSVLEWLRNTPYEAVFERYVTRRVEFRISACNTPSHIVETASDIFQNMIMLYVCDIEKLVRLMNELRDPRATELVKYMVGLDAQGATEIGSMQQIDVPREEDEEVDVSSVEHTVVGLRQLLTKTIEVTVTGMHNEGNGVDTVATFLDCRGTPRVGAASDLYFPEIGVGSRVRVQVDEQLLRNTILQDTVLSKHPPFQGHITPNSIGVITGESAFGAVQGRWFVVRFPAGSVVCPDNFITPAMPRVQDFVKVYLAIINDWKDTDNRNVWQRYLEENMINKEQARLISENLPLVCDRITTQLDGYCAS